MKRKRWVNELSSAHKATLNAVVHLLGDDVAEPEEGADGALIFKVCPGTELSSLVLGAVADRVYNIAIVAGQLEIYLTHSPTIKALEDASREHRGTRTWDSNIILKGEEMDAASVRIRQVMATFLNCDTSRKEIRAGKPCFIAEGCARVLWSEVRLITENLEKFQVSVMFRFPLNGGMECAVS